MPLAPSAEINPTQITASAAFGFLFGFVGSAAIQHWSDNRFSNEDLWVIGIALAPIGNAIGLCIGRWSSRLEQFADHFLSTAANGPSGPDSHPPNGPGTPASNVVVFPPARARSPARRKHEQRKSSANNLAA